MTDLETETEDYLELNFNYLEKTFYFLKDLNNNNNKWIKKTIQFQLSHLNLSVMPVSLLKLLISCTKIFIKKFI